MNQEQRFSRMERIKQEAKNALEFHQQTNDIPLTENFRVEASPQDPYSSPLQESTFLLGGNKRGILAQRNPFMPLTDKKLLTQIVQHDMELLQTNPDSAIKEQILSNLSLLTNQHKAQEKIKANYEQLLISVFGQEFFTNTHTPDSNQTSSK